jgi:hypothetical protein
MVVGGREDNEKSLRKRATIDPIGLSLLIATPLQAPPTYTPDITTNDADPDGGRGR